MSSRDAWSLVKAVTGLGFAGGIAYVSWLRPRMVNWGATEEETERDWPMDDVIPDPTVVTTRAITIEAPAAEVWPWLAQMGELPRGGFYSYVSVERALGMHVRNAERVMPELQTLEVGQALDQKGTMLVQGFREGEWLCLGPNDMGTFATTWLLALVPEGEGRCRMVSRVRVKYRKPTPANVMFFLTLDPGQFLMERKMLLELKRLAEGARG